MSSFDANRETHRVQDAVRRHDRPLLEQLVSERFAFVSGRALGRLHKEEWIAAGLGVDWQRFEISVVRVVECGDVAVVDYDIDQEMAAPPAWVGDAPTQTRWVITDVWAVESGAWRLVSRHPELIASLTRPEAD